MKVEYMERIWITCCSLSSHSCGKGGIDGGHEKGVKLPEASQLPKTLLPLPCMFSGPEDPHIACKERSPSFRGIGEGEL